MRKKPITRNEVRINHFEVWTLPGGSFHRDEKKAGQPIARLWKPLLDQLRRQELEWWESGPAAQPELWGEFKSRVRVVYPNVQAYCRHCGRRFFHDHRSHSKYCSDRCQRLHTEPARKQRSAAFVAARAEKRAAARASLKCRHCREPLTAQRSTARFCSVNCRVAAHREARPSATEE